MGIVFKNPFPFEIGNIKAANEKKEREFGLWSLGWSWDCIWKKKITQTGACISEHLPFSNGNLKPANRVKGGKKDGVGVRVRVEWQ